nr:hypothetical protein [Tanacetum cinerariifolium]
MIAILEKSNHNVDFHHIVDFIEASNIRYALTINPTVYVSHIRRFWSTARIETTNEGAKILATVDGKPRTVFESSIRRNLKLNDEEGISTLPDAELFENLALMGYNILPNQKFTFQEGQFSHQWKFLIHTIMQCLSPKSIGFNEFSSNIATAVVCLATNRVYNFLKMIFDGMVRNVNNKGSKFLTYPRFISKCLKMSQFGQIAHSHTYYVPFHTRKYFTTLRVNSLSFSGRTVPLFAKMLVTQGEGSGTLTEPHHTPSPQAQQSPHHDLSSSLHPTASTEPIPTATPTEIPTLRQYSRRATRIAQSKALPTAVDEHASLLRDDNQGEDFPTMATKIKAQDLEIPGLKTRIKILEDKDRGSAEPSRDDALIKERSMEIGKEAGVEKSTERGSNDTEELVNVLTYMEAANILTSGVAAVSVPPIAGVSTVGVPTVSRLVPTVSAIFTTASMVTPYSRRPREISAKDKGKEKMVESDTPKKKKIQEQIDVQVAREIEKEMAREDQRMNEQIARDVEIARIHAEEELKMLIDSLDKNNEMIAKHLQEGMTLEEIREKFIPIWKQIEDFVPMASKEEGERVKRKGLKLEQRSAKKIKTFKEVSEEDFKEKMQLVPLEEIIRLGGNTVVYQFFVDMLKQFGKEDLQQLWALVKETLSIRQASSNKEKELWVELKIMFEPDFEDHMWTYIQALMHDPLDWRLYDTCGVYHVFTKDQ